MTAESLRAALFFSPCLTRTFLIYCWFSCWNWDFWDFNQELAVLTLTSVCFECVFFYKAHELMHGLSNTNKLALPILVTAGQQDLCMTFKMMTRHGRICIYWILMDYYCAAVNLKQQINYFTVYFCRSLSLHITWSTVCFSAKTAQLTCFLDLSVAFCQFILYSFIH